MKILIDMNLPPRWVQLFAKKGGPLRQSKISQKGNPITSKTGTYPPPEIEPIRNISSLRADILPEFFQGIPAIPYPLTTDLPQHDAIYTKIKDHIHNSFGFGDKTLVWQDIWLKHSVRERRMS
jgi:hypothetical protein